eukprot:TRINITY_DN2966_c0_g1_i2.p1 TRINITY_DN2966_c0_g1~~TRINITY_DN2966_c0_g1_i2.p1  ORF type:complete len:947 (-),score=160.80 TRINITY_DN2966_c0_g1_i2:261-3041(-)
MAAGSVVFATHVGASGSVGMAALAPPHLASAGFGQRYSAVRADPETQWQEMALSNAVPASGSSSSGCSTATGTALASGLGLSGGAVLLLAAGRRFRRRQRKLERVFVVRSAGPLVASRDDGVALAERPTEALAMDAMDLDRLRREGPGSVRSFPQPSSEREAKDLEEACQERGLAIRQERSGALTVYVPGDELIWGIVPHGFDELGLHPSVVKALRHWTPEPLTKATHIQAKVIPKLLAGNDLVIQGETGSGKTLAYLLPAAHWACQRADAKRRHSRDSDDFEDFDDLEEDEELAEEALAMADDMTTETARCYRLEPPVGVAGIRPQERADLFSAFCGQPLLCGDEFMVRSVEGSPLGLEFLELADGRGWLPWDKRDMRMRFALSCTEYSVGQKVVCKRRMAFGSGAVVEPGTIGVIQRLLPFVGVEWEGVPGVKAIREPRAFLGYFKDNSAATKWARSAPDTLIVTATRELCEQAAEVARQLGSLLPEHARDEFTTAVAVGAPPGVGKRCKRGKEQWPFPLGDGAPKVLVTTLEFMGYFFHKRNLPLWFNVKHVVFDEVDRLVAGPERKFLQRVKTMFLRASRQDGAEKVQNILVAATVPSQGTRSTRLKIGDWVPGALRALPRPDLLHRQHPMVQQSWQHVPESFEEKVQLLVQHLTERGLQHFTETVTKRVRGDLKSEEKPRVAVLEKTLVFCKEAGNAVKLAETLASDHHFREIGLFVRKIGNDERRERLRAFKNGDITLMISTDILARGIDVPGLTHVIQFDFSRNVVDHLHRIGRLSRCGTLGTAMNFYDDSEQGGRKLAEAIQEVGNAPLDALFSRNRGFAKGLKRKESYRQMLLTQGLPLPPALQRPEDNQQVEGMFADVDDSSEISETPLLDDILRGVDDDEDDGEGIDSLLGGSELDAEEDEDDDDADEDDGAERE